MLFPVLLLLCSAPCSLGSSAWYFLGSLLILFFVVSASSVLFLRLVFLFGFSLRPLLLRGPPFDPCLPALFGVLPGSPFFWFLSLRRAGLGCSRPFLRRFSSSDEVFFPISLPAFELGRFLCSPFASLFLCSLFAGFGWGYACDTSSLSCSVSPSLSFSCVFFSVAPSGSFVSPRASSLPLPRLPWAFSSGGRCGCVFLL